MKYMIMMFGGIGEAVAGRSAEWVAGMQELIMKLDSGLRESGELVESRKLADPGQARTVRPEGASAVPTDGPFAEIKESLAGYWVIESDEARAVELTAEVVAYTGFPMEIRRIMDDAPRP